MSTRLPILVYHQVDDIPPNCWYPGNYVGPAQFAAQLSLLQRLGYSTITFAQYLAFRRGEGTIPTRPIILTFDDGYMSVKTNAYPQLVARGMTATVFVVSGQVGGTNAWDSQATQESLLGTEDILAMQAGGVEFQSHTHTHARLPTLTPDALRHELAHSRAELQSLLGVPVEVISYPYGAHAPQVTAMARETGYQAGVISRRRLNAPTTDPLALRRISITSRTSVARLAWDLLRLRLHRD
ncbi:MAG: polysaccharide deacetylase family protein [Gemmatimonadetes bacterium]|nr:polysaccharide deacetylase family protein [Gemmatimonadota bacterium]